MKRGVHFCAIMFNMKLVIAGIYPPDSGGPATYAVALERELPKFGIEVLVVPFGSVRHLPKLVRHIVYVWKLLESMRDSDVLLVQDPVSSGLPALFATILTRKPLIVRIGGDYAWEQGVQRFGVKDSIDDFQTKRYGVRIELLRMIQRFVVRRAKVVVAPSKYLGKIIESWVSSEERVSVVYNGVELPVVNSEPADRPEGTLIVTAGRLVPWKGFDELILVISKEKEWHLIIVGDGPDKERLEKVAKKEGCDNRVTFIGSLPRDELIGWASVADVFVLNSSYEGLSHVMLEVQSIGTPIVATNIPGNAEVITHEKNGLLSDVHSIDALRDSVKRLIDNPKEAEILAKNAQESVKDFSITNTMQKIADIIKNI